MADKRILPFTTRTGRGGNEPPESGNPADDDDELVAPGDAYATPRGTKPSASLRFLCLGDKAFAMPYAYRPIIWGESPGLVLLEYPGFFTVILSGKNLGVLEARLCENRVAWIRECTDAQAATLPTAVTLIARMRSYPSREG